MASLRFLLGMIPSTSGYESESDKLRSDYAEYKKFEVSEELKHFLELEKEVNSPEFQQKVKQIKLQNFKQTEEFKKELELKTLRKSTTIKTYFKKKDTEEGAALADSADVKTFLELENYVNSDKFLEVKKYMSLSSKEKYELSEESKLQKEYSDLIKSEKIQWYKKILKKYPFGWVEKWELSFEDKFESGKLDEKVWITRYVQGDKVLNKSYQLADDRNAFSQGKNIEFLDKKLRILTRMEKSKGLVWDVLRGFYEKEFDFTSDMISSAKGFSQAYGMIEAKVKFGNSSVTQSFSLMSDQIVPHIDIVKYTKGKINSGNFWKNGNEIEKSVTSAGGSKYANDYHIFTLIWEAGKLTWKINGAEFKVQSSGIPEKELFLVFNSSLKEKAGEAGIPSALEIDWVRVYKAR
jgi:hypothetical protein